MKTLISEKADEDIRSAFFYVSCKADVDIAQKQIDRIYKMIKTLEHAPDIGSWVKNRVGFETDRRYLVAGKFLIFYKFSKDTIVISRVLDGRQDWQKILF